jgi:hypothetical protein
VTPEKDQSKVVELVVSLFGKECEAIEIDYNDFSHQTYESDHHATLKSTSNINQIERYLVVRSHASKSSESSFVSISEFEGYLIIST